MKANETVWLNRQNGKPAGDAYGVKLVFCEMVDALNDVFSAMTEDSYLAQAEDDAQAFAPDADPAIYSEEHTTAVARLLLSGARTLLNADGQPCAFFFDPDRLATRRVAQAEQVFFAAGSKRARDPADTHAPHVSNNLVGACCSNRPPQAPSLQVPRRTPRERQHSFRFLYRHCDGH